jgi:hypothetical protein
MTSLNRTRELFKSESSAYAAKLAITLTPDEFYTLLQIGIVITASVALILTFAYLAYEKS